MPNINKENEEKCNSLNLATIIHNPESYNGLLICGYNWGGTPKKDEKIEYLNYFSDTSLYYGKFRTRILNWFKLLGHQLEVDKNNIGHFEKSISYTNWVETKSKDFISDLDYLIKERNCFIEVLNLLKPKLIFFFGKILIDAFCNENVRNEINKFTGPLICGPIEFSEKNCDFKKFVIRFASFKNCDVISFPHPTGSRGLSDDYIKLFKNDIGKFINNYKTRN